MPSTPEEAKARLERAFRVKFDREPIGEQEEILIQLAAERVAAGESFAWEGSTEAPTIRHFKEQEHDMETLWVMAKEAVCRLGFSQRDAAEKFGLSYDALRQRCTREAWPVPARIREEVQRLVTAKSHNQEITKIEAETWLERGEKSRQLSWAITEKPLQSLLNDPEKAPKVASWQDVATIVKLNRQAAGLDTSETSIQVGFAFGMLGDNVAEGASGEILDVSAEEVPEKGQLPE